MAFKSIVHCYQPLKCHWHIIFMNREVTIKSPYVTIKSPIIMSLLSTIKSPLKLSPGPQWIVNCAYQRGWSLINKQHRKAITVEQVFGAVDYGLGVLDSKGLHFIQWPSRPFLQQINRWSISQAPEWKDMQPAISEQRLDGGLSRPGKKACQITSCHRDCRAPRKSLESSAFENGAEESDSPKPGHLDHCDTAVYVGLSFTCKELPLLKEPHITLGQFSVVRRMNVTSPAKRLEWQMNYHAPEKELSFELTPYGRGLNWELDAATNLYWLRMALRKECQGLMEAKPTPSFHVTWHEPQGW